MLECYILIFEISFMPVVSFDQTHPLPLTTPRYVYVRILTNSGRKYPW